MAKTRQIVLIKLLTPDDADEDDAVSASMLNAVPLGSYRQVVEALSAFNTNPDGSNSAETFGLLYGPGFMVQMPMVGLDDPVMQAAVSMQEDDIAWTVLARMCKRLGWRMMDPNSGRTFG